ncbi:diguanylate cyclase domain protein [Burkholderia pseudomallei]|nr:diguanylate cyclase domain protein [Burkholderia pseudomallei]CAJ7297373.1 diguanylate cyclase domain protein [Burkholderia pseudomallei]
MDSAIATPQLRKPTILVVNDTPANLASAIHCLETHDFVVVVATTGEEALRRAQRVVPDLILLDVMRPGMSGFETCRKLKAMGCTRDIPVLFMIELSDLGHKATGFAAGGVDYITKPFQSEELATRVKTHLTLHALQQQLAAKNALLQAAEIRYRRLFETAKDGIVVVDLESGRITDVNPSLMDLLGYSRHHFMGRVFWELPPFDAIPNGQALCDAMHTSEHVRRKCASIRRADAATLDVEFWATVYVVANRRVVQCHLRDITERKQAECRVQYIELHDALTGLPNRTLLQERLNQAIKQARSHHTRVATLMIDLDRFKHINDSLGHRMGDRLLEATSKRLRACVRESDMLAHLGGDEFVIGLPELHDDQDATEVVQRVQDALAEPFYLEGHQLNIGCSIGISCYPADGKDAETLLRAADIAMYDAKSNGRGGWCFFTPALDEAAQRRLMLSNDVRHACERGEFVVHYQPQVCARSGAIHGVEALLRWQHPEHGLISPDEFVPLLEDLGLMVTVGEWVLAVACRQAVQWQREGRTPVRMAVNLSAQQFRRGDMVHAVKKVLDETGLAAKWLELELTETIAYDDTESAIRIMHDLKGLGVTLSLDDFGTGWSSLSYLRRFPLDRLKIDRSFIRDMAVQSNASVLVRGIMSLAQSLGLDCVAEGVETTEQLEYLQTLLCSEIQGFLFSEALSALECGDLLPAARKEEDASTCSSLHENAHRHGRSRRAIAAR